MGFNPSTFLKNTERIITGKGFKRVIQGVGLDSLKLTTGLQIPVATANLERLALETSYLGVAVVAGQTDLGMLMFQVPRDYDKSIDKMYVRLLANSAGATNAPTIDATLYQKKPLTALSSDLNPTISAAVNLLAVKAGWVEVKAETLGLEPGAMLTWTFTTGAHATDILHVYGLEVVYYSDLVYYVDEER